MSERIGAGIIGTGGISRMYIRALLNHSADLARIVAVSDIGEEWGWSAPEVAGGAEYHPNCRGTPRARRYPLRRDPHAVRSAPRDCRRRDRGGEARSVSKMSRHHSYTSVEVVIGACNVHRRTFRSVSGPRGRVHRLFLRTEGLAGILDDGPIVPYGTASRNDGRSATLYRTNRSVLAHDEEEHAPGSATPPLQPGRAGESL